MPRVLALYPGTVAFRQEQLIAHADALRSLDVQVVLADDCVYDSDREVFAECLELPAPENVGESLSVLESWCAKNRIDGVVAQSEGAMLIGSLIAEQLGLPSISPRSALLTTSKFLCRRVLENANIPQPRFTLASTADDVRSFAREAGYPLVLKGVASALARLVTFVEHEHEVDAAVARVKAGLQHSVDITRLTDFGHVTGFDLGCDPRAEFLVETFVRGVPVETDGIVCGNEIHTFGITEQALSRPPLFFMEGYLLPADRPQAELEDVERVSDAALRALAVANTGFSIEMRIDAGRASVIEVNGRLGWDEGFGDLFARVTGAQPAFQALAVALGAKPPIGRRTDVACAIAYQPCYEDRVIAAVPSDVELRSIETRHGVLAGTAVYPGTRMHAPPHPDVSPHLAWTLATDPRSSRAAYERARVAVDELRFVSASV